MNLQIATHLIMMLNSLSATGDRGRQPPLFRPERPESTQ